MRGFIEHARPTEPCGCQDNRVTLSLAELANARFDVPAKRDECEVRTLPLKLHEAAARSGPDLRASLEGSQIDAVDGQQDVARILAHGHAEDAHAVRQGHVPGHVFERVDRKVGVTAYDHRLDLAHEESLAANLGKWAILDTVARRSNVDFLDREIGKVSPELGAHPARLNESEVTPACCNA